MYIPLWKHIHVLSVIVSSLNFFQSFGLLDKKSFKVKGVK